MIIPYRSTRRDGVPACAPQGTLAHRVAMMHSGAMLTERKFVFAGE